MSWYMYTCDSCGISCRNSACYGENDDSCAGVYCSNYWDDDDYWTDWGTVYPFSFVGGYLFFCLVLPCIFTCCSVASLKKREAQLPQQLRTMDGGMLAAFWLATICFGFVGWGVMHCILQSRIDQQINIVQYHDRQQGRQQQFAQTQSHYAQQPAQGIAMQNMQQQQNAHHSGAHEVRMAEWTTSAGSDSAGLPTATVVEAMPVDNDSSSSSNHNHNNSNKREDQITHF